MTLPVANFAAELLRPAVVLAAVLVVAVGARLVWAAVNRRRRRALQQLAATHQLRFSQRDRFSLRDKVQAVWPQPAARLAVADVLYRNQGQSLECFCTVRYAEPTGRVGRQVVRLLVAPRVQEVAAGAQAQVSFGPPGGDLVKTYAQLIDASTPGGA